MEIFGLEYTTTEKGNVKTRYSQFKILGIPVSGKFLQTRYEKLNDGTFLCTYFEVFERYKTERNILLRREGRLTTDSLKNGQKIGNWTSYQYNPKTKDFTMIFNIVSYDENGEVVSYSGFKNGVLNHISKKGEPPRFCNVNRQLERS